MKKIYILGLVSLLSALNLNAQDINLTLQGGYFFDDSFDSYFDFDEFYEGKIEGGFQWGVGVEYMVMPENGFELSYLRQDTNSPTTYYRRNDAYIQFTNFDLGINYIMLGGNRYFRIPESQVDGFIGLMAGVVTASVDNPENGNKNNATKFAWGAKFGGVYWFLNYLGFKAQANIISSVQAMGGGLYFGTGGTGAGLSSYSTIYQFGFAGGLVFKFNR
ncbi:hypothetical protein G3I01_15070 [Gramella sp. MT6]|uniref:hypothetical protein n=1 Tax=Gramella sp. MT6 TaxID=2705471 RepID=UPI001C5D63B2|nr:hypothetical protein [Gramella sp. MT6]QYA26757.1 hypothetical protein G3I01_15070 [Gramella sp. MT6]